MIGEGHIQVNINTAQFASSKGGSIPACAGQPLVTRLLKHLRRSIPTCAGQPGAFARNGRHSRVYPHVCGAAISSPSSMIVMLGLSPRVRGSRPCGNCINVSLGSIPTCAGQPVAFIRPTTEGEVYPHVCGAACPRRSRSAQSRGLSPRVSGQPGNVFVYNRFNQVYPHVCRGSPLTDRGEEAGRGSIPTCAGQPSSC